MLSQNSGQTKTVTNKWQNKQEAVHKINYKAQSVAPTIPSVTQPIDPDNQTLQNVAKETSASDFSPSKAGNKPTLKPQSLQKRFTSTQRDVC